jgi:hypothetical protein
MHGLMHMEFGTDEFDDSPQVLSFIKMHGLMHMEFGTDEFDDSPQVLS